VDPQQASKEQRTLSRFLRNLQLLWQESQPLPEPKQKRRYTHRMRALFAEYQEQIEQWLDSAACMNAAEILRRLMALGPGSYHEVRCARWSGASRNGEQPEQSGCWGRWDQPARQRRQRKRPLLSRHQLEVTVNDAKRWSSFNVG
jgi:hypothetical protein